MIIENYRYRADSGGPGKHRGGGGVECATVATDVRLGFVSIERAASDYGVVIDQATYEIDEGATRRLRSAGAS